MEQIVCNGVTLGYGGRAILENLSFSVRAGEYFCIVGENGSGKTTLMNTLLGLQPPLAGQITLADGLCAADMGYLPQQTPSQREFPASVREIVLSGAQGRCGLRPFYRREEKARARQAMEQMGIAGLADRCYRELSGGQQQRVLLARALCAAGKILLLDEPVAGLDPAASAELYRLIQTLNREQGMTILMVSHDLEAVLPCADRLLQLGRQRFLGTPQEYQQSAAARALAAGEGGGSRA